jgi:hypothetical protein
MVCELEKNGVLDSPLHVCVACVVFSLKD